MLTRAKQEALLPIALTVKGQGDTIQFNVTYFNRKQSDVAAKVDDEHGIIDALLFVIKDMESEYELSKDGLAELEDERPGMLIALIEGFHQARQVQKVKN